MTVYGEDGGVRQCLLLLIQSVKSKGILQSTTYRFTIYKSIYNLYSLRLAAEDTGSYRFSDKSLCLGGEGRRDLPCDVTAHETTACMQSSLALAREQ